ncbi:hypothetical protein FOZ60_011523 [Perkinsus olseni]|uniref:MULE transposase domain-containing protein n=1 Tax=Perkinsus olseni TaxID=32597 RepID=A0A7J6NED1_PEROL|nr:hypothetical protein FOZ60_011523 [Perkinsus olseni]
MGTQFIPTAYALLLDATEATYRMALRELRSAAIRVTGQCNIRAVMTDFETPLRRAITSVFGIEGAELRGCLFYAHRAWLRRLVELGLGAAYREQVQRGQQHSMLNTWLHRVFGLSCLRPEEVPPTWDSLVAIVTNDARVADFRAYMERTWVRMGK